MNGTSPLLSVRGAKKRFGDQIVLDGVDLDVHVGEVLCIIGPSGSGKSTLLRLINHLETLDEGEIRIDGELVGYEERDGRLHERPEREICKQRQSAAMVFQHFNLFLHLTAVENVAIGLRQVRGLSRSGARERALRELDAVGLVQRSSAYPRQLSGGQQQRVAIARALAMDPRLVLFDECTSALDPQLVGEVLSVMQKLAAGGMTMVVVTHEIAFARRVADRVVFMENGRVVESGPPSQVIDNPRLEQTRQFLKESK